MNRESLVTELAELRALSGMTAQVRGRRFERWLNGLLRYDSLDPRSSYRPEGEEIDGSFVIDGRAYLLEAKWKKDPLPASSIYEFKGKVDGKLAGTIGFFISMSGFSTDAIDALIHGKELNVLLVDDEDIEVSLRLGIRRVLERKIREAVERGTVFFPMKLVEATTENEESLSIATVSLAKRKALVVVESRVDRQIISKVSQLLLRDLTTELDGGVDVFAAGGVSQIGRVANSLAAGLQATGIYEERPPILVLDGDVSPGFRAELLRAEDGHAEGTELIVTYPSLTEEWLGLASATLPGVVNAVAKLDVESLVSLRRKTSFRQFEQALSKRLKV
jgi:hypothetical protein